jgi:hypothetical protein
MLPVKAVRLQLGALLAADSTTLAPGANGNEIALFINNVTPTENNVIGDFTPATFTGSTAKVLGTGTQNVGVDPTTGEQVITMLDPVGGLNFICTVAPAAPQTVYGFILQTHLGVALLAIGLLPNPVTITNIGDMVAVDPATLRIIAAPAY